MVTKWDLIYELHADEENVRRLQDERAKAWGSPSSPTPYPLGSKPWWAAVNAGTIDSRRVEGTITEAQPTSMPDRQEFRMRTTDGSELSGVRHGDPTRYVEGLCLRLDYVTLQRSPELERADDVVIAVWIEHSHKRTPYLHSISPSPFPI